MTKRLLVVILIICFQLSVLYQDDKLSQVNDKPQKYYILKLDIVPFTPLLKKPGYDFNPSLEINFTSKHSISINSSYRYKSKTYNERDFQEIGIELGLEYRHYLDIGNNGLYVGLEAGYKLRNENGVYVTNSNYGGGTGYDYNFNHYIGFVGPEIGYHTRIKKRFSVDLRLSPIFQFGIKNETYTNIYPASYVPRYRGVISFTDYHMQLSIGYIFTN